MFINKYYLISIRQNFQGASASEWVLSLKFWKTILVKFFETIKYPRSWRIKIISFSDIFLNLIRLQKSSIHLIKKNYIGFMIDFLCKAKAFVFMLNNRPYSYFRTIEIPDVVKCWREIPNWDIINKQSIFKLNFKLLL